MKATGIVRRIDDLGRVVIPKEIRRTMRIREGDPLEIYTDNEGGVIFKKYSQIEELTTITTQLCESVNHECKLPVVICDRDHCIACAGISRREVNERRLTPYAEEIMEHRKIYTSEKDAKPLYALEGVDRALQVLAPIMSNGDIHGAIMLLDSGENITHTESDLKLISAVAAFLGKQMEE